MMNEKLEIILQINLDNAFLWLSRLEDKRHKKKNSNKERKELQKYTKVICELLKEEKGLL